MSSDQRRGIIQTCASIIGKLHSAKLRHGCLYPKHLFLRMKEGSYAARLIDLEKTRTYWWPWRERIKDLDAFLRNASVWHDDEQDDFLAEYLNVNEAQDELQKLKKRLQERRIKKEKRK
jgi:hypothetical protein